MENSLARNGKLASEKWKTRWQEMENSLARNWKTRWQEIEKLASTKWKTRWQEMENSLARTEASQTRLNHRFTKFAHSFSNLTIEDL